jgi:hypothetical protein
MARTRLLMAALAGLLVSFVVFVALYMVTPQPDLLRGEGDVQWERFQFVEGRQTFTAGSVARFLNEDGVPLELVVITPDGREVVFVVPPGGVLNVTLDKRGAYRVGSPTYPWADGTIEVRSANPFIRFWEDLQDFELRSRRSG